MNGIKLLNLNIEADKHLDSVREFLQNEEADVICLQEVLSKDVEELKSLLKMDGRYSPTMFIRDKNVMGFTPGNQWGVLLLSKIEPIVLTSYYYAGNPYDLPDFKDNYHNSDCRVMIVAQFEKDKKKYTIATTHFTWSEGGKTTEFQLGHFDKMKNVLGSYDDLILCGDFNAPRGEEIWSKLASSFTDNIPAEITTTIDQKLHRIKGIQLVVDGIFSTRGYSVTDVHLKSGVSDHMALTAQLVSNVT